MKKPTLKDTAAMLSRRIVAARQILCGNYERVAKLIDRQHIEDKPFIVIGSHEPYFAKAYRMIRTNEMKHGTWAPCDEVDFKRATNPGKLV